MSLKYISFLFTPILWVLVLTGMALITQNRRRKQIRLIIALGMLIVFSSPMVYLGAHKIWEVESQRMEDVGQYKVGVVLGGYTFKQEGTSLMQLGSSGNRLMSAIQLYHAGKIEKLLLTGGLYDLEHPDAKEAPMVQQFLVLNGVKEADIIIDPASSNTHESAVKCAALLNPRSPGEIVLITSAYHMRRARDCFWNSGFKVVPFSPNYTRDFEFHPQKLIPSANILFAWDALIHEWVSYPWYWINGYV
jgi:uncharacterized SAM-binding protein YcdF (DUF218 family)